MSVVILLLSNWSNLAAQSFPQMKCSIIDSAGREIVPCRFRSVSYVGSGLFLLREVAEGSGAQQLVVVHVVDRDGKNVQVHVPKDTILTNLFVPLTAAREFAPATTVLPTGTIVEIKSSQGYGLADLEGQVILEPEFQQISRTKIGLFAVYKDAKVAFAFDMDSRKKVSDPRILSLFDFSKVANGIVNADRVLFIDRSHEKPLWGYFDSVGNVAIEPQFESATSFEQDGFARVWFSNADPNKRRCFIIDKYGKRILSPEYESIFDFHDGLAVVRVRGKDGTLRFGIIDKKFEYVLQPDWMRLDFLCGNIYVAQRNSGEGFSAVTPDGTILFKFPAETFAAKESHGLVLCYQDSNPDEMRFVRERKNISLLTLDGKTIFSARNCKEIAFSNGIAVLAQDVKGRRKIEKTCTIITKSGVTANGVKAWSATPVESNRLIKSIIDLSFSRDIWKRDVNSRNEQFANLLASYDLIGMPRAEIEQLLGTPDFGSCYRNYMGMCGSVGGWIEFKYDDDRVEDWRWASHVYRENSYQPWVTTNVIYDYVPFPRIGESPILELTPKPKR